MTDQRSIIVVVRHGCRTRPRSARTSRRDRTILVADANLRAACRRRSAPAAGIRAGTARAHGCPTADRVSGSDDFIGLGAAPASGRMLENAAPEMRTGNARAAHTIAFGSFIAGDYPAWNDGLNDGLKCQYACKETAAPIFIVRLYFRCDGTTYSLHPCNPLVIFELRVARPEPFGYQTTNRALGSVLFVPMPALPTKWPHSREAARSCQRSFRMLNNNNDEHHL